MRQLGFFLFAVLSGKCSHYFGCSSEDREDRVEGKELREESRDAVVYSLIATVRIKCLYCLLHISIILYNDKFRVFLRNYHYAVVSR